MQELRLNSLITSRGEIGRVTSISHLGIIILDETRIVTQYDHIDITPEILHRLGFTLEKGFYVKDGIFVKKTDVWQVMNVQVNHVADLQNICYDFFGVWLSLLY